jgi:hypothetical protein
MYNVESTSDLKPYGGPTKAYNGDFCMDNHKLNIKMS